jgi:hypothetical protein
MRRVAPFVILIVTSISASAAHAQPPADQGRAVLRLGSQVQPEPLPTLESAVLLALAHERA